MAKAAILDVLESTIGRYVQNLDAQSLNVAVWSGKIELNSLRLDTQAVNRELKRKALEAPNLALPFRILEGSFESLRVDVPWARITSRPVVLRAKGLNCLIEPYNHLTEDNGSGSGADSLDNSKTYTSSEVNESLEEVTYSGRDSTKKKKARRKLKKDERLQSLAHAEEARQRRIAMEKLTDLDDEDTTQENVRESQNSAGFKARLVRRIVENLQLEIDGVHFEIRGRGCDAGVVLEHFSIVTTDKDGNRTFVDRASNSKNIQKSFLYKVLQLKGLGIYCDRDVTYTNTTASDSGRFPFPVQEEDDYNFHSNNNNRNHRSFILAPLSFEAKMRQSDCLQCIDFPKYLLSSHLNAVSIVLTRTQLELIHNISQALTSNRNQSQPLFPEYRPTDPIRKGTAKLWWKYAVRSVGRINRRRSWTEFFIAFQKRKEYISLYKRMMYHSSCSWLSPLTEKEKKTIDLLELDRTISVEGIMGWRNMADAQIELETRKYEAVNASRKAASTERVKASPKKSTFSFFGSKRAKSDVSEQSLLDEQQQQNIEEDESPITLTTEEMKELQFVAFDRDSIAEETISNDSKLCDVEFKLGSFKVDLISFNSQPMASLDMGTVLTALKANADGSFLFNFTLSSLNVHDRITPNSLFPTVVRSLESTSESKSKFTNAFEFKLMKDKNGDQELITKLVSFEIVASSILLKEMKEFFSFQSLSSYNYEATSRFKPNKQLSNPILQESITGGADLFYDADELGASSTLTATTTAPSAIVDSTANEFLEERTNPLTPKVSDKVASAFADAWGNKVEKETLWKVYIEVYAPILVLPKSCVDRMAPTLVVDLGNFCFTFGTSEPSVEVQTWFNSQPMVDGFDSCTLQMENLSFVVAKAGDKDWVTSKFTGGDSAISSKAIIEPITLMLSVGIEKNRNKDIPPRKCLFGMLPSISLNVSCSEVARMMSVVTTWGSVMESMSSGSELIIQESDGIGENSYGRGLSQDQSMSSSWHAALKNKGIQENLSNTESSEEVMATTHLSLALTKLSLKITDEEGDSVEAHLVSAVTSLTQNSDESSSIRIRMGYFWILDRLKPEIDGICYPREQRLIAHSCLPASATSFATNDTYDIMGELERQGLLENVNMHSGSLADVTMTKFVSFVPSPTDQSIVTSQSQFNSVTTINAKFSTLFINWNPYAIRNLFDFKDNLTRFIERVVSLHISKTTVQLHGSLGRQPSVSDNSIGKTIDENSLFILNAQMEALDLCLNSAKDDLPLFQLTMADAKVKLHSSKKNGDENKLAFVDVGDFRLEVPSNQIILSDYCTVLGLSPNHSSSLLSIEYGKGSMVINDCPAMNAETEEAGSYIKIALSPMRFVHIQAQVLTLAEYITAGVLGTFAAKVASSAARAAKELADAETGGTNVILVSAEGFDFVLPQAVDTYDHICLKCGHLSITFRSFLKPGHGEAKLRLDDVTMTRNGRENIVETPIQMDIDVKFAPLDAPSQEDRATIVAVTLSSATFLLTKDQFFQFQRTLIYNIGELNSYLRGEEELSPLDHDLDNVRMESKGGFAALTHGGAEEIIIEKRTRIYMAFESLCLELCGKNAGDPIISLAAVETSITLELQPDTQTTNAVATMHDLVCYDKRLIAQNRHFRHIISQVESKNLTKDPDVFKLSYLKSNKDNSMSVDLGIGSPQVLLVPDLISDVLAFFADNEQMPQRVYTRSTAPSCTKNVSIEMEHDAEDVEIVISNIMKKSSQINVKTSDCRLVLIDVGSAQKDDHSSTEVMETVVIKGQSEVSIALVSDVEKGSLIESDISIHAETLEAYTAEGRESNCPVQILEPLKCSMFLSTQVKENTHFVDVKFVTLTNVDMIISFQNLALLQSTISSMKETFTAQGALNVDEDSSKDIQMLSEKETAAIEKLALELGEGGNTNDSISEVTASEARSQPAFRTQSTFESQSSYNNAPTGTNRVISCKMTLPFASVTVINDLQGLDEALFKLMTESCVFGADIKNKQANQSDMTFRVYMNTRLQADYFDSNSKLWEQLLLDAWELNLKATRGQNSRFKSTRMATTIDIESHPCKVSFSEQFIVGLGTAKSMLSAFSVTTIKANKLVDKLSKEATKGPISAKSKRDLFLMKSRASCTARSFIVTMPYGIENHCGLEVDFEVGEKRETVDTGCTEYFRFDLPRRNGIGGVRSYGQYSMNQKMIKLHVGDHQISFDNLDEMLNQPRLVHKVGSAQYIFSDVRKTGSATIVHLSSFIEVHNETSIDFNLSVNINNEIKHIGRCRGDQGRQKAKKNFNSIAGYGIPLPLLKKAYNKREKKGFDFERKISLVVSTDMDRNNKVLTGDIQLPSLEKFCEMADENDGVKVFDLFCSTVFIPGQNTSDGLDKMALQVSCKTRLIADEHPFVEFFLQPRTVLQNNMSTSLLVRTPMPHTWSKTVTQDDDQPHESIHIIEPFDVIEVYTPGPSIAISVKCADNPTGGTATDWNVDEWIDIPLKRGKKLQHRIRSYFPFVKRSGKRLGGGGNVFFIAEASDFWGELNREGEGIEKADVTSSSLPDVRRVVFAVDNVGIDHTGNILFQTCHESSGDFSSRQLQTDDYPLCAFSSADYKRRITLLPKSDVPICLLQLTMEGSSGMSPSLPFRIEDISLCEGGIDSTIIQWENSNCSQYYAYRTLSSFNQAEIHIIPEFVVFNGGKHSVRVIQPRENETLIDAGKMAPIRRLDNQNTGLIIMLDFLDIGACTVPVQVDRLGMNMCIVKENSSGSPVGSIAIQTVIGSRDSRFVIKLGQINRGSAVDTRVDKASSKNVFANDILRFRIRWSQFEVALHDTKEFITRKRKKRRDPAKLKPANKTSEKVAQIVFERFTVDFQRIFKDEDKSVTIKDTARSQITVLVKNVRITDCTSNKEAIVLESSAIKSNFIEFCARTRGSANSGLVCVDLLDFKLAHDGEIAEQVALQTNEAFLWNILDVAARTQQATEELSGVDFEISWDDNISDFSVQIIDAPDNDREDIQLDGTYRPPKSDYLYDIRKASVSPMILLLSFKREPQSARYKTVRKVRGAKLVNYFTKQLKFTVDGARLKLPGYTVKDVRGPSDRILETFTAFYASQLKKRLLILLSATSLDDWKNLAGRDVGSDQYIDGDILRVTGNLVGKSAGFVFKKVGQGIGQGLSNGTSAIGGGIQSASETLGVGAVGAGINSLVSGIGGGVGDTVEGVGAGGNKIIKGAGRGVGQIVGGVGGGILLAAKGIGKGVVDGDGSAVASGLGDGVVSIGNGLIGGTESVVTGTAEGFYSVGKGLFSGVRTIGKGVGRAVSFKETPNRRTQEQQDEANRRRNSTPR